MNVSYLHFAILDSTHTWVKQNRATLDPAQVTCVIADEQTAGRGREGRLWLAPKGDHAHNIYATLYFCLSPPFASIGNLGQLLSLACTDTLRAHQIPVWIKWPNDLIAQGKKLGGILCETSISSGRIEVILSLGLNIDLSMETLAKISQPAISLTQLSTRLFSRQELLDPICKKFFSFLTLLQAQGFGPFYQHYQEQLFFKEAVITHREGTQLLTGHFDHITPEGQLVLRLADGSCATLTAGELI